MRQGKPVKERGIHAPRLKGAQLVGLGHYAPQRIVPSAEIETAFGLEAGWIESRTGIANRRYAAKGETLSDMAAAAAEQALSAAEAKGVSRDEIGMTILATSTPDHLLPPSAPLLAHKLGLSRSGGIDMAGACAGFLYALTFADGFVRQHNKACLIVAANLLSRRINPDERDSAILFADAAGAMVLTPCEDSCKGVLSVDLTSDGSNYDLIKIPAGGSAQPFQPGMAVSETLMTIADGRAVFSHAVQTMAETASETLKACDLEIGEIDHWVPHQANKRIFGKVQQVLGLDDRQLLSSIANFGNSSAATIPFTLSHEVAQGRDLTDGDLLLFSAVGAGLTGGAVIMAI
ncbi:MAG: beta-ketoacyl-ACP synthase III [Cohaesibacter sp.]|jgi:3-oxoacyl-[acyl-carrier-protein] synthase-3|nr:beta-ketoacyl-ACP synthase III [Cohaesibacter sp.]